MQVIKPKIYSKIFKSRKTFCMICESYKTDLNNQQILLDKLPKCGYYICSNCFYEYIYNKIENKILDIKCPITVCPNIINASII